MEKIEDGEDKWDMFYWTDCLKKSKIIINIDLFYISIFIAKLIYVSSISIPIPIPIPMTPTKLHLNFIH